MVNFANFGKKIQKDWLKKIVEGSEQGWSMNPLSKECNGNTKICVINPTEPSKMLIGYVDIEQVKDLSDEIDKHDTSISARAALAAMAYSEYSKSKDWKTNTDLHINLLTAALCYFLRTKSYLTSVAQLGEDNLEILVLFYPQGKHDFIVRPVGSSKGALNSPSECLEIMQSVIKNDLSKGLIKKKNLKKQ